MAMLFLVIAVAAAAQSAEPLPIDSIIVTGERTRRSQWETQPSVSVASQRDIENASADRVEQMLALIPNVQLGSGSEGPAIRGLDTTGVLRALPAFLGGNRPRTTLVVDGRRDTYNEFVFGVAPTWDVNRIEVFRSPQTTTEGQNSIAGAIFVYTNEPSFKPEVRARLIGGDYKTHQMSALASGPVLGDEIAFRIAGDYRYSRTTSRIADRAVGADPNHDVYGQIRAKLLVKPDGLPGSQLMLGYSHLQGQAPQVVTATPPFRNRRDESGFFGTFRTNVDSVTAALRREDGAFTTNVILTAGNSSARRLAFPGLGQSRINGTDRSAEAVVNWAPEGTVRGVAGISNTHLALRQSIDLSLIGALGHFRDVQVGTGVFGEASLTVLPRTIVTLGARYQQDRQRRRGALSTGRGDIPLDFDRTFHAWLPKLSVSYDSSHALRVGMLVERAYNPGGTTLRFDIARPDNFEAETLWDYELFVRARLGRAITASANVFYYAISNAQRAKEIKVIGPKGFPVAFADIFNAPKARSYGLEAELVWRPSKHFSSQLALGLLDTRIVRSAADHPEFAGNQFGRSPHLSASAKTDWETAPRLWLSAQVRHHSSYFSDDGNGGDTLIHPATLVDARAEYRASRFTLFASLHNLFNSFALIERDASSASLEGPRQVTLGVDQRF